jgi:NAD dependent epimerase/dehydratase family enzyme
MGLPKLVLVGGNGFLGRHLRAHFQTIGYEVVSISRTGSGDVRWDARSLGPWAQALEGAALLVNLAGRTVDCRYNAANRRAILASRTESTRVLGLAVAACTHPPKVWLNSSTATIYADTPGSAPANTEAAGVVGEGFSVDIATSWEAAFNACPAPGTRKVALRTSFSGDGAAGALRAMHAARLGPAVD